MDYDQFINGERLQQIADIYLGAMDDIVSNPVIFEQIERHQVLNIISSTFDNPPIMFLYPHNLRLFASKLPYFANPFSLITHNSDVNLTETNEYVREILGCEKLVAWWGQNLCFIHPKMRFIPIGLANTMWEHGKIENLMGHTFEKTMDIHLNFHIYTNVEKRRPCADALESRAGMLPMLTATENIKRLAKYRWCACPEGNGVDTHRLWEAFYMRCVPIVVKTPFIDALMHYTNGELPIYVVDSWWDFELPTYESYLEKFSNNKWLNVKYYRELILETHVKCEKTQNF
jgi:hypothetical protein